MASDEVIRVPRGFVYGLAAGCALSGAVGAAYFGFLKEPVGAAAVGAVAGVRGQEEGEEGEGEGGVVVRHPGGGGGGEFVGTPPFAPLLAPDSPAAEGFRSPLDAVLARDSERGLRKGSIAEESILGPDFSGGPVIIGVGGASGSGKTTIATRLRHALPDDVSVAGISSDSYYRPLGPTVDAANYNFDHPEAMDAELITAHLHALKEGKGIDVPVYDFKTHTRKAEVERVESADIVILDGIFTLAVPQVRRACDLTIFTLEDLDVCLARRLLRDIRERGRSVDSVLQQYQRFVKPGFHAFIEPSMAEADLIIPRARDNDRAIAMLARDLGSQVYRQRRNRTAALPASPSTSPRFSHLQKDVPTVDELEKGLLAASKQLSKEEEEGDKV